MKVEVLILASVVRGCDALRRNAYGNAVTVAHYVMDHDDPSQRRVLGEQCRNAFEAGQSVVTNPI